MKVIWSILVFALSSAAAFAEAPVVVAASAEKVGMGWRIAVTLRHADEGWDHFADTWDVVDANGVVLGERQLMHPHITEQPFTRSLSAVSVPDGTRVVYIRAHCSESGWTGPIYELDLSLDQ